MAESVLALRAQLGVLVETVFRNKQIRAQKLRPRQCV